MLPERNRPEDIDAIPEESRPTKATRVINKFVLLALVTISISLGIFLKWSFEATPPLVIKNSPFSTRSIPPDPGVNDVIVLDVDYCKRTSKQGAIRTSYVSKTREIFMAVTKEQYEKGCFRRDIPILIPSDLPTDTYKLKFVATYNLNPLKQNVQVTFESQEFTISEHEVNESAATHEQSR